MQESYNLQRFLDAQEPIYEQVLLELRSGIKRGHWIWYIFPQVAGLGVSPMSEKYSVRSIDEAAAYLDHPILGERLIECVALVSAIDGRTIEQIFGYPDYLKFRSCLTLFQAVEGSSDHFQRVLEKFFDGVPDPLTIEFLQRQRLT